MRWRTAGLSLTVLLTSCATAGHDPRAALSRFPIGIYGVDDPHLLGRLKESGFDSFHTYASDPALLSALAKEAIRQRMRMVIYPDRLRAGPVSATAGWPVDAWYLQDEPEVVKMSSMTLQSISAKTREWDPRRLQTFVIGKSSPAATYGGIGDVMMLDWYPVPHLATDSVADQIDFVRRALPAGKPVWMVVQAYDWADEATAAVKAKHHLRFPTRGEMRFMSYLAVLHGARGLFFFTLRKKTGTLFDHPDLWGVVSDVARELRAMQPVFESGTRTQPPFPTSKDGVEAGAWRYRGRDYLILVNRRMDGEQRLPAELMGGAWREKFGEAPVDGSMLRHQGVLVFERVVR